MKIAVISDIHDNLINLEKCLGWCKHNRIDALLCCGDVTNSDTLTYLAANFSNEIYLVKGNIDFWQDSVAAASARIHYLGRQGGAIELGGKTIGLCHEPHLRNGLIAAEHPAIVFFGHTHQPWEENRAGSKLVNPGTLGGMFQKATFAVYDTISDKLELKILEEL